MEKVAKRYSDDKARLLLSELRKREKACNSKLDKIYMRIALLEEFVESTRGKKITLKNWLKSKGINCKEVFAPLGYYTPIGQAVSNDYENKYLTYHKGMVLNPATKGYVPEPNVVGSEYHNAITKSKLGMTFDPALQLYFPTTIYDTELYASAEGNGEDIIDIVGSFSSDDIGNFSAFNDDSETIVDNIIDLYEEEYDNIEGELDTIYQAEDKLIEEYSNLTAKERREVKEYCRKKYGKGADYRKCKRQGKKAERKENKQERKEDREARKEARKEKRADIKKCKADFKAGKISKAKFKECKKAERKAKREAIKEAGGSFIARVGRGVAKVFPLTASSRGGIIILAKINAFGFSTRVAPALVPESEAKKLFKPEAIKGAKKAWKKISNAFKNLGGNPENLEVAILDGYKKKASKVERKSALDGSDYKKITIYEYSNVVDPATATLIATGISAFVSLLGIVVKNVGKDPYKSGEAPQNWEDSKRAVDDVPAPDPDEPQIDPETGEWIDPETGKRIDPLTGTYKDEIFGMNQWLFFGILGAVVIGGIVLIAKRKK